VEAARIGFVLVTGGSDERGGALSVVPPFTGAPGTGQKWP
jgi:hypothetical protein